MIIMMFTEEKMEDFPEYPASVTETTIENQGMPWPDLMKVFARQLPKMGYELDVGVLEEAIENCLEPVLTDRDWS
jgi:hypothetical protein